MSKTIKNIYKNFTIFSLGFFVYLLIEFGFRGYTFFLSGIMGGIATVCIDKINDYISWDLDFIIQCIIGSCIITFLELCFGTFDRQFLHLNMWDYSNLPLNYNGIICLPFSIIWCFLSAVAIIASDINNYYFLGYKSEIPYYKIFGKVIYRFD